MRPEPSRARPMRRLPVDARLPSPVTRRELLQGAGALVIGVCLPLGRARAEARVAATEPFAPNAFVRVTSGDTVTVLVKHVEFGQGPMTGLATLVAEEMDADWARVNAEHAPANAKLYNNLLFGPVQATG